MARFTVRVQLHGVSESDDAYDTLHDEMRRRGFTRTIASDTTKYEMPWGSYNYVGEKTIDEVLDRARAAAASTGYNAAVLVTEGSRRWHGLERSP